MARELFKDRLKKMRPGAIPSRDNEFTKEMPRHDTASADSVNKMKNKQDQIAGITRRSHQGS